MCPAPANTPKLLRGAVCTEHLPLGLCCAPQVLESRICLSRISWMFVGGWCSPAAWTTGSCPRSAPRSSRRAWPRRSAQCPAAGTCQWPQSPWSPPPASPCGPWSRIWEGWEQRGWRVRQRAGNAAALHLEYLVPTHTHRDCVDGYPRCGITGEQGPGGEGSDLQRDTTNTRNETSTQEAAADGAPESPRPVTCTYGK